MTASPGCRRCRAHEPLYGPARRQLGGIRLYVVLGAAGSSAGGSSAAAPTSPGRGARSAAGRRRRRMGRHETVSCGAATLWTSSNMDDGVIDGEKSTTASSNWSNVVAPPRSAPVREGDMIAVIDVDDGLRQRGDVQRASCA